MKRGHMVRENKLAIAGMLLSLAITFIAFGPAQAAPQYNLVCSSCHGMPPLDSAIRDVNSGAFQGNHQTHQPVNAQPANCTICHNSAGFTTSHENGQISFQSNINTSPSTGQYKVSGVAVAFKNQTSVPVLGSCSSVNCHFESISPSWGSTNYSSTANCSSCHSSPGTSTGHSKHDTYFPFASNGCIKCHPDYITSLKFNHATSAGHRGIKVSLTEGSYSGTGLNYLPSQSASRTFGNCTNLYCHSDGTKASGTFTTMSTAKWGSSLTCKSCHGYDVSAGTKAINTYAHAKHINNAAYVGKNIGCQECHAATTTNGTTIGTIANHVDKNINIKFDNNINKDADAPTYNSGSTTGANGYPKAVGNTAAQNICNNVYCHSNGTTNGATPTFKPIAWNASPLGCDGCHGGSGKAHPTYASGSAGSGTANSHVKHVETKGYSCDYCHINTTTDITIPPTTVVNGGSHLNRVEDVNFKLYGGKTGDPYTGAVGQKNCTNTYCHSDGAGTSKTAQWGGKLDCRGCHGGDKNHANPIATNKHGAHINNDGTLGANNSFQCAACHVKTISTFANNTTITGQAFHVNTLKDYSGARAGKIIAAGQCSNVYCHSSGQATPVFRNMTGSKLWTGTASLGCNGCHGYGTTAQGAAFNSVAGEPNYANVTPAGGPNANSHQRHVTGAGITDTTGCARCHDHTVDSAAANKLKNYTTHHIDGNRDVIFSVAVGGTYNQGAKSCSSTKCHGTSNPPVWGGASLSCTACHGATFTTFSSASKKGAHAEHFETNNAVLYSDAPGNNGTTSAYQFACSSCHFAPASHTNLTNAASTYGVAEVFFGYTTTGRKPTYNYGTSVAGTDSGTFTWTAGGSTSCNATYCHSNGQSGTGSASGTAVAWNTAKGTLGCTGCHGNATSNTLSGKHQQHVNNAGYLGTNFKCAECHAKTVSSASDTVITDKTKHINKFRDYSGARAGKNAADCSNIYCHSDGKGTPINPGSWTAGAAITDCKGCHGAKTTAQGAAFNSVAGEPNYASVGVGLASSNSHFKHVGSVGASTCDACHTLTTNSGTSIVSGSTHHLDGNPDVNFNLTKAGGTAQWAANRTCNNISCHNGTSVQWGQTGNCDLCHPTASLKGAHAKHINGIMPTFYSYTANNSSGNDTTGKYGFGCSNCHPLVNSNHTNGQVVLDFRPVVSGQGLGTLRAKNSAAITTFGVAGVAGGTDPTSVPGSKVICLNVYCHSNGYTTTPVFATTPEWYTGSFAGDRCANCHGNSPNSGIAGSAAHGAHVVGIHQDDVFNGTSGKLAAGSTGSVSHGLSAQATTINCNICHNATVTYARNDRNPSCSTTGCHSTPTNLAQINNRANHVNGKVELSFQNIAIVSKAQLRQASFSSYTAAGGYWTRNGAPTTPHYKDGATAFDTANQALTNTMWNAGTCSNIACHMGKPVNWNDTTVSCQSCHSRL